MKLKLKRIVSMLTRMVMKTDVAAESPAGYDADNCEHRCAEHEHEHDWGAEPEPCRERERSVAWVLKSSSFATAPLRLPLFATEGRLGVRRAISRVMAHLGRSDKVWLQ